MDLLRSPLRFFANATSRRPARRTCILHAGSPKTATFSIQSMLKKNRRQFLKHGILVPESGQRPYGAHHELVHDLAGPPAGPAGGAGQAFIREVLRSSAHTVLISSENLWPLLGVEARAERLIAALRALDLDVTLLVYVRNQPQYLNSSYVQNVKTWLRDEEFSAFARRARAQPGKFTYSRWMTFAQRHKAAMLVRPYSKPVREVGVTEDFLATIGLSSKGFDTAIERNVAVGPFSVEVARRLMRRIGGPSRLTRLQADQCRSALRSEIKSRRIEDRGYCGLTTAFAAELEAHFAADNAALAHFAWGRPWRDMFASDVGQSFEPNDYAVTGVPADRAQLLAEVLHSLEPRVDAILSSSSPPKPKLWSLSGLRSRFSP